MSQLLDAKEDNLYQAPNSLALVLMRGGRSGQRLICKKHTDELLTSWKSTSYYHMKRKTVDGSKVAACSMPPPFFQHCTLVKMEKTKTFHIDGDETVEKGVLLHPGLPVCEEHNLLAKKVLAEYTVKKTGHRIRPTVFHDGLYDTPDITSDYLPYSERRDPEDPDFHPPRHQDVKIIRAPDDSYPAYAAFMRSLGLGTSLGRKPWFDLSDRHRRRKVAYFTAVINKVAKYMAPEAPEELKKLASKSDYSNEYERDRSPDFIRMMTSIKEQFELADSRSSKLASLSIVSHLPISEIHRYLPSLSEYFFSEAKKYARRGSMWMSRGKCESSTGVKTLTDSSNSSHKVTVGLPFGVRRVRDGSDRWSEIPNTLRQLRVGEILHLYKSDKANFSSWSGYDNHGGESIKLIDRLLEENLIDADWHRTLRMKILQGRQYLRTDYLIHSTERSSIGDHCQRFGLSDPSDKLFQSDCSTDNIASIHNHDHTRICERCEALQLLFGEMRSTLEDLLLQPTSTDHVAKIERWRREWYSNEEKSHQLRTSKSEEDRSKIVESLREGDALVTLDWAMKLLPHFGREATADLFGQRGLTWHVTNVLTFANGEYRTHNLIHIFAGEKQDSPAVTSVIRHTLTTLKARGINNVYLRSDQAGCYRSSATIASLPSIAKATRVNIVGYYYSEAQASKSEKNTADSGGMVVSPDEFFNAVTSGHLYNGISNYLVNAKSNEDGPPEMSPTKIDEIAKLTSFTFERDGLRVHRFRDIGEGRLDSIDEYIPNNSVLTVTKGGGKILPNEFWGTVGDSRVNEKKEAEKEETSEMCRYDEKTKSYKCERMRLSTLYRCPLDTCGMEFLSERNLEKHLQLGKHREAPERVNLRDYSLRQFSRFIEIVAPQKICSRDPDEAWSDDPLFDVEEEIRQIVLRKKDTIFDMAEETQARILELEKKNAPQKETESKGATGSEKKKGKKRVHDELM